MGVYVYLRLHTCKDGSENACTSLCYTITFTRRHGQYTHKDNVCVPAHARTHARTHARAHTHTHTQIHVQTLFPLAMELSYPRLGALTGRSRQAYATDRASTLCAVAAGVPHPDKVAKGLKAFISKQFGYAGEDAYIALSQGPVQLLAMADGVASWWEHGIDAGEYSRRLVSCVKQAALESVEQVLSTGDTDWRKGSLDWPAVDDAISPSMGGAAWGLDPDLLLWRGWTLLKSKAEVAGSCTACVVSLDRATGRLRAANLGDSGFMLVRVLHFEHGRSLTSRMALRDLSARMAAVDLVQDHLEGKGSQSQHAGGGLPPSAQRELSGQSAGKQSRGVAAGSGMQALAAAAEAADGARLITGNGSVGVRFEIVYRSAPLEHSLGHPKQLGHHPNTDQPSDAESIELEVRDGDFIVMGTDGLFDNLGEAEIAHRVVQAYLMIHADGQSVRSACGPTSRALVADAFKMSTSKHAGVRVCVCVCVCVCACVRACVRACVKERRERGSERKRERLRETEREGERESV